MIIQTIEGMSICTHQTISGEEWDKLGEFSRSMILVGYDLYYTKIINWRPLTLEELEGLKNNR